MFLGAVTLLQWACLHSDPSSLPLADIFPRMSQFPINQTLVKEKQPPNGLGSPGPWDGGCVSPKAAESSDWGPLVTHCYAMYWQCLTSFLKWAAEDQEVSKDRAVGETCSKDRAVDKTCGTTRVAIGSADVAEVARCCLDSLDAAAFSVGLVIESVSTVLPKVLMMCRELYNM